MEKPRKEPKVPEMAPCTCCGRYRTKSALMAAEIGGARCRDWFACAQVRAQVLGYQAQQSRLRGEVQPINPPPAPDWSWKQQYVPVITSLSTSSTPTLTFTR